MSGRKLGGGRVLGSGKGLAPPTAASPRPTNALTPSDSTASLGSSSISPPASAGLPDIAQPDIGSSISVGAPGQRGGSADASALVCPICNEEMVSMPQTAMLFWGLYG